MRDRRLPMDVLFIFDPLGNAVHTALSFDVLGEDVLMTGAGPIGCMAAAIVRHAGARHRGGNGCQSVSSRTRAESWVRHSQWMSVEKSCRGAEETGHAGGVRCRTGDVGQCGGLRDMLANMCHGGKIAMLGIPEPNTRSTGTWWYSTCSRSRHLWARNVRDLVQDDGDAAERIGHFPGDHAPVSLHRIREGLRGNAIGPIRKGDSELGGGGGGKNRTKIAQMNEMVPMPRRNCYLAQGSM